MNKYRNKWSEKKEVVFAYRVENECVIIVDSKYTPCKRGDWLTGTQIDGNGELIAENHYTHVAFKTMYEFV